MYRKITNSKAVFNSIKAQLTLSDRAEAHAIVLAIMEKYFNLSLTDILSEKKIDDIDFSKIIERINHNEPLQYIFGETDFFGRKFKVNPSVLIPRPETELLIQQVVKEKINSPRILDIGTGSGCIAITLKLEIPEAKIFALDISAEALVVARQNSENLNTEVEFILADFINSKINIDPVDILVSNPPYVRKLEKESMKSNVLNHEPHLALFVTNDDPLIFYRAIAEQSKSLLKPGGKIFVEINEHLGSETKKLFESCGLREIKIMKDLDGKDRIVSATHSSVRLPI